METKQELNPGEQIIELWRSRPINLDDVISLTPAAALTAAPRRGKTPHHHSCCDVRTATGL